VSLRSLEAAAAYPAKALQLIATAASWQQQQQQGDAASGNNSSTTEQAAAVGVCLAAAQELLPHMSASSIAHLLVSMAALQLVDPALLQPAQQTAAAAGVPAVELGLLLELAARELAAGRNRGWLLQQQQQEQQEQQQQQQQQQGVSLSELAAACKVLSMSTAAMARLGLE
jgi:hypothetical protein